jgi:hypothetical protein
MPAADLTIRGVLFGRTLAKSRAQLQGMDASLFRISLTISFSMSFKGAAMCRV